MGTYEIAKEIVVAQIEKTPLYFARDNKGRSPEGMSTGDFLFDPTNSGEAVGQFYATVLKAVRKAGDEE